MRILKSCSIKVSIRISSISYGGWELPTIGKMLVLSQNKEQGCIYKDVFIDLGVYQLFRFLLWNIEFLMDIIVLTDRENNAQPPKQGHKFYGTS